MSLARWVFLGFAILALFGTWYNNVLYFAELKILYPNNNTVDNFIVFFKQAYTNGTVRFICEQLLIFLALTNIFYKVEGRRKGMHNLRLYIVGSLMVAVSMFISLFLFFHENNISLKRSKPPSNNEPSSTARLTFGADPDAYVEMKSLSIFTVSLLIVILLLGTVPTNHHFWSVLFGIWVSLTILYNILPIHKKERNGYLNYSSRIQAVMLYGICAGCGLALTVQTYSSILPLYYETLMKGGMYEVWSHFYKECTVSYAAISLVVDHFLLLTACIFFILIDSTSKRIYSIAIRILLAVATALAPAWGFGMFLMLRENYDLDDDRIHQE